MIFPLVNETPCLHMQAMHSNRIEFAPAAPLKVKKI